MNKFLEYSTNLGMRMRMGKVLGCYRHASVHSSKEAAGAGHKAVAEADYR